MCFHTWLPSSCTRENIFLDSGCWLFVRIFCSLAFSLTGYECGQWQHPAQDEWLLSAVRDRSVDTEGGEEYVCERWWKTTVSPLDPANRFVVLQVMSVNPANKEVKLSDGTSQRFNQLLISTGCRWDSSSIFSSLPQTRAELYLMHAYHENNDNGHEKFLTLVSMWPLQSTVWISFFFTEQDRSAVLVRTWKEWSYCRVMTMPKKFTAPVWARRL